MRREVQQFVFPALRFVQQRRTMNQHRLQLRQLLLLALRCAIICLLAFALARPTLRGSGIAGKEDGPIAAALVFDNSLRMAYLRDNQTRLDKAQELANWLLEQLPADCPLTVIDRTAQRGGRDLDRAAAELRIERMATSSVVRPWNETLRDAADWLRQQRDHRGEMYVFTDMASAAWTEAALADLGGTAQGVAGSERLFDRRRRGAAAQFRPRQSAAFGRRAHAGQSAAAQHRSQSRPARLPSMAM